ncbi:IS5 family transposase [Mesorhizobium sp.]|uniref:IS5 family transposase n=2 Tax=Mesorhizobium sp. TaxID=1871066 RepID=UPI00257C5B5C|nr:IS5 family transposase [Mesorhizobium sp.]
MVDRVLGQLSLADGLAWSDTTQLDQIATVIDWMPIRALLGQRSGPGKGNTSYPAETLLRCLFLGVWNNLSDPALEMQLRDRLSFRRFAGFSLSDRTPDHSTLWRFREELKRDGLIDASFMRAAARPPAKPKKGEETSARPSADPDARWGRKGKKTVFGYKVHNGVDEAHTLIRRMHFTDASITDTLICGDEEAAYGDQAYYTHARHARLKQAGIKDRLMHRPNKHHPLTPRQKQRNRLISKVRAAVERPFAVFKQRYGMRRLRFFNLATNRTQCSYNLQRATAVLFPVRKPA